MRPESARTLAIRALFEDGAILTSRDVADEIGTSVQIAAARLHRMCKRDGRLIRTGERGDRGGWGYLYRKAAP